MIIKYDDNATVLIDKEGNSKGTRFFFFCNSPRIETGKFYLNSFINTRGIII